MAEISLKCEVPGCSFLTPRLLPRFYGEMVEHLKVPTSFSTHLLKILPQVHHLSCHGDNGPRSVSANSTPAARMDRIKIADGEEAKKILDLNMNTKSAGNIFVCSEPGCLFKTEYQSNMVRHKKNKHLQREQNGESYEQMTLGEKRFREEEVEGSRAERPANKLIKLHCKDLKRMEGETGDSWRVNNCAGAMSQDEACVEKETAAVELEGREGGKMKWTLGGVLCPNCQIKFRSVSELTNHKQTCIRRTSNATRSKKKREHDSNSSDVESEDEDDENVATCQGCEMSFASVAGLDAHRQRCNMKVRCDVNKLKGEGEVEGNNNFKLSVCEDSKLLLEVNDRLESTKSIVIEKLDVVGCDVVGEKFGGAGTTKWDLLSKEVAYSSLSQDAVNNTGELSERGKGDTLGHAGHPQLDVNFSKSKSANAQNAAKEANLENKSDASPMLEKRVDVSGGGSWSDFIAENGACPSSETPPRRRRTTTPRIPQGLETPQNASNKGGAETKAKMLVDFLSKEGKPFRINLTLPRDCNMHRVLAKIADNFKTDIDQLSLSRKGIELTGEERAEDFEGEVVVVRPRMAQ